MSDRQINWINDYHKKTAKRVGDELKKQGKMKQYDWLMEQTKPIVRNVATTNVATTTGKSISFIFVSALIAHFSF
ncbi:xaa-Pro aminopeptidase 1 [Paramuricea clavata]|uniref:Xaa-Pro aminopeptidase 1 n=2 Tax=Paramuricea clavata TaxID=317549 RepID=A0A7D9LRL3_PARCT|nr:xaa-Pro aminopeptidase 1 [Paramuricea clavata]